MNLHLVLLILLASYGITFTLTQATILSSPRRWVKSKSKFLEELLSCAFCTGFWCSQIAYFIAIKFDKYEIRNHVLLAFAGAAFCYALDATILFFERSHE